jgi:autotransporter-associated beta strand protein
MKKCIACRASRNHRRLLAALSVGIGLAAQSAFAVDFVWTRGASNNNWDAAANWAGAVAPPVAPATGDTTNIIFSGTSVTVGTSLSLRQNYVIDSMTFASDFVGSGLNTVSVTTPSTLLTGATSAHLTIGAGGITSNVVDFNLNIQKNVAIPDANLFVPVDQTWALNAPAASTGAKTFSVSREVVGTGRVTKTGTGVLVLGGLTANANWSGGFDLVEGSVRTGGLTSGHNGHFGTGSISSTSANDVSITASTVTGQGGGGDRVFDNDLTLGGTGQLQFAGGFNLGFTSNSTWTLVGNKRLATSLVTNHDGNITGGFGITKLGGGMLVLSGASNYTGNTDVVEGVVHVRNSAGLGGGSAAVSVGSLGVGLIGSGLELSNGITVSGRTLSLAGTGVITAVPPVGVDANAGALRNRSGNNTWTGQVSVTAPDTLIAVDSGELNLSGGLDGAGTARVAGAGLLRVANVRAAGLTIDGSTVVRVNADGTSAGRSTVSALSVAGGPGTPTATLDLTNNALVVDYTGASVLADIKSLLLAGRAGGTWTGPGLTSSTAAATAARALGIAEASSLPSVPALFGTVDASAVLVRYTIVGDADLDGQVGFGDLLVLAQNFDAAGSGKQWSDGDSDYNGVVDFADLLAIAQNYNGSAISQAQYNQLVDVAGQPFADAFMSLVVPEPTLAACAGFLALVCRRPRR